MKKKYSEKHYSGKRKLTTAVSAFYGQLAKQSKLRLISKFHKSDLPVKKQLEINETGINFFGLLLFALIWISILIMIFRF